jgi:hypothetical protein
MTKAVKAVRAFLILAALTFAVATPVKLTGAGLTLATAAAAGGDAHAGRGL